MKALSLLQPWASLIAIGAKKIETRSWRTHYRGPLAIASSKVFHLEDKEFVHDEPHIRRALQNAGVTNLNELPLGKVLCTCTLVDCVRARTENRPAEGTPERAFGDFSFGRFMWMLEDVRPLVEPVPVRGAQGLWEWDAEWELDAKASTR